VQTQTVIQKETESVAFQPTQTGRIQIPVRTTLGQVIKSVVIYTK